MSGVKTTTTSNFKKIKSECTPSNHVARDISSPLSLLQAEHAKFSPLLLMHYTLQPKHRGGSALGLFQCINLFLAPGSPRLDASLEIQSHSCQIKGQHHFNGSAGYTLAQAAWMGKTLSCCTSSLDTRTVANSCSTSWP